MRKINGFRLMLLLLLASSLGCDAPAGVATVPAPVHGTTAVGAETASVNPATQARAEGALAAFPRPPDDNGWGIHWAPTTLGQSKDVVDYFVAECKQMGIKWVKFLNGDAPKLDHEYLVRSLLASGMMPVMRVYTPYNEPYENLPELVRASRQAGVRYFELYNEPNVAGKAGGWRDGETISVPRLAELWIVAAGAVIQEGGFPGLPSLAPGGDYDDNDFLAAFLDEIVRLGRADLFTRAWLPLHNYFLNHPVDYPYDEVNVLSVPLSTEEIARRGLTPTQVEAMNHARQVSHLARTPGGHGVMDKRSDDSNGFRKFEAYEQIAFRRLGTEIPVISTEGGAMAGAHEDPRYPVLTDDDVSAETLYSFRYMLERAPAYYFAFTPWVLANNAGGHPDPRFEAAAWYKAINGPVLPVVAALKHNPLIGGVRVNTP